jgi:hypothetical protein
MRALRGIHARELDDVTAFVNDGDHEAEIARFRIGFRRGDNLLPRCT